MKTIVMIAVLSVSTVCLAEENAEHHRTPFEKLEHVFNHGYAARLSDFTFNDGTTPGLNPNDLKCINQVSSATDRSQIAVTDRIPYVLVGRIVAGQALPDNGPLFPGRPERDEVRQAILWGQPGFRETQEQVGQTISQYKIHLHEGDDELVEHYNDNTRFSWRINHGLLVEQDALVNEKGEVTQVVGYEYCWSTSGKMRRDERERNDDEDAIQDVPAPQQTPVVVNPAPQPQPQHRRGD